jgi:N-acetylmuramoyl-L-alanine amidase
MKICLDAGHGNGNVRGDVFDPGAVASGIREADIALEWALTGKFIFASEHIPVYLTRNDNTDITPISKRDDMATAKDCTHFISIHCNAANGTATGVEAYYRDQRDKVFAKIVLDCLVEATGLRNRGLKAEGDSQHARLAVLNFGPPAVLIEVGFIDNPVDRAKIRDRAVRMKFFELLAKKLKAVNN